MTVGALFTKSTGQPATGLTLTDIDLYLYSRAVADGTVATVWNGENPTEEVGGGLYTKAYASANLATYEYSGYAQYTGATTLDSNYALQTAPGVLNAATDIADEVLKRGVSNVEDSASGTSLAELLLAAFESGVADTTWTIYKTDHSTTFSTRTVTTDADAEPIIAVT